MQKHSIPILLLILILFQSCQGFPSKGTEAILATNTPLPAATVSPTIVPTFTPTTPVSSSNPLESAEKARESGDWESALAQFQSVIDDPLQVEIHDIALSGMGRALLLGRKFDQAGLAFEKLINDYPNSSVLAETYFYLSQAQNAEEKYYEASQSLLYYLAQKPGVVDAYIFELRGDTLFAAGDYANAVNDYQAALQSPSLLDEINLGMKLARSYALAGDITTALAQYEELYNRTPNDYTKSLINLRRGQANTAIGQSDQALEYFQDVVNNFPSSYEALTALNAILEAGGTVNLLQAGIIYYYAGEYGNAFESLDEYLQANPADPAAANYFYGLVYNAQAQYPEAIQRWENVIKKYPESQYWDDATDKKAYTQWAVLANYEDAIKTLLDFVESAPDHKRSPEFLFDAGLISERADTKEKTIEIWKKLADTYPNYVDTPKAIFLLAINLYRLENFEDAKATLVRYIPLVTTLNEKSSAQFWIGKTEEAMGNLQAAREAWEITASMDPTGYYSERARDLLHDKPLFEPPLGYDFTFDEEVEHTKADEWIIKTFKLPMETNLEGLGPLSEDAGINRGTELWKLGLYDDARAEFEQVVKSNQLDPANSYRLANYFVQLGANRPAILAARQVLDLAAFDDASSLSAPPLFNRIRFGTYFSDLVLPLAQEYGFHPLFLFALIRQESLFDAKITSAADAKGLMQIIPSTGMDIYSKLGWPEGFSTEDLFLPNVNLKYGVDYLNQQREYFKGDIYTALAAYNGGPGNAELWQSLSGDDPDLFLEMVRFSETRNYLRGIYELFTIYRLIYERSP